MDITFDGTKLNDMFYVVNLQGLGMPTTKDRELEMVNVNGSFYEGTNLQSRYITLTCTMLPTVSQTIYQRLDTLKGITAPWKGERQLILGGYPNRYIMARYSGSMDIEQIAQMQTFPLTFKCADPLFYSNTPLVTTATFATTTSVTNLGNWPTKKVTLQVTIPANTQRVVLNTTTSKQLVLKNSTASALTVLVDFATATITSVDKLTNYNSFYISGEFFTLQPGINSISIVGNAVNATFTHNSSWI